ncbi:MAG: hypothetical protein LBR74_00435, partial [Eubacterium sp.]|nr:hypothetical protein [Eubacterium sp.]
MTGRNKNGKRPDYEFDYDEKFIRGRKKGDGAFEKIADAVIPMKGDRAGEFIRKIVFLLSFACVILLLIMIVLNLNESINGDGLAKSSKINPESEIFGRVDIRDSHDAVSEKAPIPEVLDEYIELYERNSDLVGWVKIDGTEIDYPVLQAEDN